MSEVTSTELIKSVSIETLLIKRYDVIEKFKQIQKLAGDIKSLLSDNSYTPEIQWYYSGQRENVLEHAASSVENRQLKDWTKAIDRGFWAYLMQESGNLTLMDAKAKEEWQKSLNEHKFPELTAENITATFTDLHLSRGEMFDRGVINVFKSLSWDYKTNSPFRFTKRLIVSGMNGYYSTSGGHRLDDLMRCFHVFDGKPEVGDYQLTIVGQVNKFKYQKTTSGPEVIDNEYMTIKVYGNGNGHVLLKREDLIVKLNNIIGRYFSFHIPQDNKAPKQAA